MVRKLASAVSLALLLGSGGARALGLGDIDLHSALNQPLSAEIALIGVRAGELDNLRVALASNDAFSRVGLERLPVLSGLRFELVSKGGRHVIKVTSSQPIREPFLDFLVDINWKGGQLTREFTVLLDPPVLMPAPAPVMRAPVTTPKATPIAAPAPQATPAPTSVPAPRASTPLSAPAPVAAPAAAPAAPAAPAAAPAPAPRVATDQYLTRRNDTLWAIASQVRPDSSVTINQVMQALLRANPEAFVNNNINNLKTGYILRVPPSDEILAINREEAKRASLEQNQRWRETKAPSAEETPVAPAQPEAPQPDAEAAAAPKAAAPSAAQTVEDEAKLKLLAPKEEELTAAEAAGSPAASADTAAAGVGSDLREELNLTTEAVETQRQETEELRARLSELEQQIATMQRLITLKDEQLAGMQADAGGVAPSEPVAGEPEVSGAGAADSTADMAAPDETPAPTVVAAAQDTESASVTPPAMPAADAAAEPEAREPSLLSQPATLGMIGSIAVVLAALFWFIMRRRQMTAPMFKEQMTGQATAARSQPAAAPVEATDDTVITRAQMQDVVPEDEMVEDEVLEPAAAAESDPIAEADFYLAYGRYQQAEDLIKGALEAAPSNELRFKLAEIYHATRNADAFNEQARQLRDSVGGDDMLWEQTAALGRDLDPTHPLYNEVDEMGVVTTGLAARDDAVATDSTPDFFEFESSQSAPAEVEEPTRIEPPEIAPPDTAPDAPAMSGFAEAEADEGLDDEVNTKLELARAYIDMGDSEGARSILDEVLAEGNADQQRMAEELLLQVS